MLQIEIDKSKNTLLKAVQAQSQSRRDFELEISSTIMRSDDKFEDAVIRIQREVERQKDAPFAEIKYETVFNEKVVKALSTKELKGAIENYIRRYN